jgi:hypothetical protein
MSDKDNIGHLIALKEQLLKQFPNDHFLEKSVEQLKKTQSKITDKRWVRRLNLAQQKGFIYSIYTPTITSLSLDTGTYSKSNIVPFHRCQKYSWRWPRLYQYGQEVRHQK